MAKKREYYFETLADIDIDSAVLRVGLHHGVIGPPRPGFTFNAGAVEVSVNCHHSDIDAVVEAFKTARKAMRKAMA